MFDIVEFVKQQERFFCEALTEPTLTWAKESQFEPPRKSWRLNSLRKR
ncbi:hypothetical protein EC95NR1_01554 [Escherichia coli]|nr:hypothetical protein EC95JB1_01557 [Escherichia coli]ART25378.1 hypothetical protein EC95NR1_01554 [Escherichia coli]EIH91254.1 hypothetical protein ECJB195_4231 [Escherichia coli JB1-95]ERA57176.1 hypothetical protein L668_14525 [Escherichia coli 95NR1]ERD99072.1 hypothetical protein L667_17410 [Escherichia coli 95JB1]